MSQWIDRINDHPVWNELTALGPAIDRALVRAENDVSTIDGLERIRTVLASCGKRIASTDPVLLDPRALTGIVSQLTPCKTAIEAYETDGNPTHIIAANAKADDVLVALASILSAPGSDDLTVINSSLSSYRTTLETYLQSAFDVQQKVKAASESNEEKLKALETAISAEQQRLATLLLDQQTQFSTAQDKRASEFATALTEQQTKSATAAADQQTAFSTDQDTRKSEYAASQIANQEKFAALLADYSTKLNDSDKDFAEKLQASTKTHEANLESLQSSYEAAAEKVLAQIRIHQKDVEKLVGVIGNLGVTSGYQKVANLARTMLFLWQFITVAALGGLILIAYQIAFPSTQKLSSVSAESSHVATQALPPPAVASATKVPPSLPLLATTQATASPVSDSAFYQGLATRIFLSLTFGIFAACAARQASHFLEMERKNRKLALELEALGPFIAPLDKTQQDEFRIKIGDRSFGMHESDSHDEKAADPTGALDVFSAKQLGEFAAAVAKGAK